MSKQETIREKFISREVYHSEQQFSNNMSTQIAYIKKSKLKWVATQLNTFIIVGETDSHIRKQEMEDFVNEAYGFAKNNNAGLPRGFQAGVGVIAVLIGPSSDPGVRDYCQKLSKHFAGFKIPVLVETGKGEVTFFKKAPLWGNMYYPYFRKLIGEFVQEVIQDV